MFARCSTEQENKTVKLTAQPLWPHKVTAQLWLYQLVSPSTCLRDNDLKANKETDVQRHKQKSDIISTQEAERWTFKSLIMEISKITQRAKSVLCEHKDLSLIP